MNNYILFKQQLSRHIQNLKRDEGDLHLIAASKYCNTDEIRALYELGQIEFGENRLQDALPKIEALKELNIKWHFFGHVQTNKAKKIIENFSVVHSLDSFKLGQILDKNCAELQKNLEVFIQVNLAREDAKSGYEKETLINEFKDLMSLKNLKILGLMIITPLFDNAEDTRPLFRNLRLLQEELNRIHHVNMNNLSMGMSTDWQFALMEGATHLRIGRALL